MSLRINHNAAASALRHLSTTNDETSGVGRSVAGSRTAVPTAAVPTAAGTEVSEGARARARGINVANENLAAAGNAVRDADQASAMATNTKLSIMAQADSAKAAQAHLTPDSVLQLLLG